MTMHEKRAHIHTHANIGDKVADLIATFVGSWSCVLVHSIWFASWFLLRLDINLLTLIVSLEAIFLCIFLLMSQNRTEAKDALRDNTEAGEVEAIFEGDKLLHSLVLEVREINRQQSVILEALPKSGKVTR